jgi:hypothetical protein
VPGIPLAFGGRNGKLPSVRRARVPGSYRLVLRSGQREMKLPKLPGMELADDIRREDIRRIVLEKLQGFRIRQAIREAIRARTRRRKRQGPPEERQEELF